MVKTRKTFFCLEKIRTLLVFYLKYIYCSRRTIYTQTIRLPRPQSNTRNCLMVCTKSQLFLKILCGELPESIKVSQGSLFFLFGVETTLCKSWTGVQPAVIANMRESLLFRPSWLPEKVHQVRYGKFTALKLKLHMKST